MENSNTIKSLKELESSYLDGKYGEVLESHLQMKDSLSKGLFHYNLGTIYAKEGRIGAARYNLEKSKMEGFSYPGLNKNLDSVTKMIGESKLSFSEKFISNYLTSSVHISLFISLIFVLILVLFKKANMLRRKSIFISLLVLSFSPLLLKVIYIDKMYKVGINITKIKMYEGPSEIYPVLLEIPEGQKVFINKSLDDWFLIAFPTQYTGWIKRSDIGLLK